MISDLGYDRQNRWLEFHFDTSYYHYPVFYLYQLSLETGSPAITWTQPLFRAEYPLATNNGLLVFFSVRRSRDPGSKVRIPNLRLAFTYDRRKGLDILSSFHRTVIVENRVVAFSPSPSSFFFFTAFSFSGRRIPATRMSIVGTRLSPRSLSLSHPIVSRTRTSARTASPILMLRLLAISLLAEGISNEVKQRDGRGEQFRPPDM